MSQNSYLREFCAQVEKIVFLADLTVLRLIRILWAKMSQTHISASSVHKFHRSCLKLIWPLCGLLELYEQKGHKTHISASFVHKYHKSCSYLIWPFYGFLLLYEQKCHKISPRVLCTSVTNRVLSWLDRFTPFYNCMKKIIIKVISPRDLFTNVTNRVLNWFDRFTVY